MSEDLVDAPFGETRVISYLSTCPAHSSHFQNSRIPSPPFERRQARHPHADTVDMPCNTLSEVGGEHIEGVDTLRAVAAHYSNPTLSGSGARFSIRSKTMMQRHLPSPSHPSPVMLLAWSGG